MSNQPTLANIWYRDNETPTLLVTNYVKIAGEWQPQAIMLSTAPDWYRYVQALGGHSGTLPSGQPWKVELVQIDDVPNILDLIDNYVDNVLLAPSATDYVVSQVCHALTARTRVKEYMARL